MIAGVAPSSPRSCSRASAFARYCAFVALQGVGVWAPKSSFSAISGVLQPVTWTAKSNSFFAFPSIVAGIGRRDGRTDPVVEMQVEEDRRRACRAHLRRHDRAGGDGEHHARLRDDRRVVSGVVDPERRGRRQAARVASARVRSCATASTTAAAARPRTTTLFTTLRVEGRPDRGRRRPARCNRRAGARSESRPAGSAARRGLPPHRRRRGPRAERDRRAPPGRRARAP